MIKKFFLFFLFLSLTSPVVAKEYTLDLNTMLLRGSLLYPDIKKKYHELKQAYLRSDEVFSKRLPTLNFTLNVNYLPYIYNYYELQAGLDVNPSVNADFSKWSPYIAPSFTFDVPVYTFGKISNAAKASEYNIELKKAELEETESAIKYEIKRIFWSYYQADYISKYLLQDVLEEYEKNVAEKEKDFSEGKITRRTFEDYKIEYFNYKRQELELERIKKEMIYWIKLIGDRPDSDEVILPSKSLKPIPFEVKSLSYYMDLAKKFSFQYKKSHYGFLARKYYHEYQQASLLPDIGFGGYFNYYYSKFNTSDREQGTNRLRNSLYPGESYNFGFAFQFRWNGINTAKIINKQQNEESYLNDLEQIKLADQYQEIEIKKTYDLLLTRKKTLDLAMEQFKASKRSLIFSINAYRSGTGKKDEYMTAIVTLYWRKRDYYQTIYDFNLHIASFEKQLGIDLVNYKDLFNQKDNYEDYETEDTDHSSDKKEKDGESK